MMKAKPVVFIAAVAMLVVMLPLSAGVLSFHGGDDRSSSGVQRGNVLYVGGTGPNNYSSIQAAIDDAADGWTVYVYAGNYQENIVVNKSIALRGISTNGEKPVINSSENTSTVAIVADGCVLSGFVVKSHPGFSPENPPACVISTNHSIIEQNTFMYGWHTCYMKRSSYNTVKNNEFIQGYWTGLKAYHGSHNIFSHNIARDKQLTGFLFYESHSAILSNTATNNTHGMSFDDASNCTISSNRIYENIQYGMGAAGSANLSIANNTIHSHYYGGMLMTDCTNCTIRDNKLYDNQWGVSLESNWYQYRTKNKNNLVKGNLIRDNEMGIMLLTGSRNNVISNNIVSDITIA